MSGNCGSGAGTCSVGDGRGEFGTNYPMRLSCPMRHVSGDSSSASVIVVFEDLECPMCRVFDRTLESVTRERSDIAVVHVPSPLDMHRFAIPAARGAACAELADSSRRLAKVDYANQDSIGLKSCESLAREAGMSDTTLVGRCARNPRSVHRVEAGIALGDRLGLAVHVA
jgi:hypothetical protein